MKKLLCVLFAAILALSVFAFSAAAESTSEDETVVTTGTESAVETAESKVEETVSKAEEAVESKSALVESQPEQKDYGQIFSIVMYCVIGVLVIVAVVIMVVALKKKRG